MKSDGWESVYVPGEYVHLYGVMTALTTCRTKGFIIVNTGNSLEYTGINFTRSKKTGSRKFTEEPAKMYPVFTYLFIALTW